MLKVFVMIKDYLNKYNLKFEIYYCLVIYELVICDLNYLWIEKFLKSWFLLIEIGNVYKI